MAQSKEVGQSSIPGLWAERRAKIRKVTRGKSPDRENGADSPTMDEDADEALIGAAGGLEKVSDLLEIFTNRLTKRLDTRLGVVVDKIAQIVETVKEQSGRIEEVETRVSDVEDTLTSLSARVDRMDRQHATHAQKLDDLENRSRRNNLRILGLPEQAEGKDAASFVSKWLPQLLGLSFPHGALKIDRAHRIAVPQSRRGGRPRALILRVHNFQDKQKILNAARDLGSLTHAGEKILIFADFSPELQKTRQAFGAVKKDLGNMGYTYAMLYPAKLKVLVDNKPVICATLAEAERLVLDLKGRNGGRERSRSP